MARLSIDFPSVAASFSQNVSRLVVEKTLSGQRLTESCLKLPACSLRGRPLARQRQSLLRYFTALVLLKCCIDFLRGSILSLRNFGRRPCTGWECHDLAPMSRSSFLFIQRQKQNANRLPIQNVKV